MKWITHQAGAVFGALALTLPLPAVFCSALGAVAPDAIDQRLSKMAGRKRQKTFNKIHRGSSHWFGWWLLLFLAALAIPIPSLLRDAAAGFALGSLIHVGMDALTPRGVPMLPTQRKFRLAIPVCSTGKAGEYLFLATITGTALLFWREDFQSLFIYVRALFLAD